MKTRKYYIACSWILLGCFVAGQYMIYAHQHATTKIAVKSHGVSACKPQQTVSEKCYMCDVMHHNAMATANNAYFSPVPFNPHIFKTPVYTFISLPLTFHGGRAPPVPAFQS